MWKALPCHHNEAVLLWDDSYQNRFLPIANFLNFSNTLNITYLLDVAFAAAEIDASMRFCKKDVTSLLAHWSYVFLALTYGPVK